MQTRLAMTAAIAVLYLLHQDVWLWRAARPLVFGFLPLGLAYHAAYCLAAAVLMWTLAKVAWPRHLEAEAVGESRPGNPARGVNRNRRVTR